MVFWILSIIVIALVIWWLKTMWENSYSLVGPIFATFGILAVGVLGWVFIACAGSAGLAAIFSEDEKAGTYDVKLKAIAAKDTVQGRGGGSIFARYGYVEGVRVISYISEQRDGGFKIGYLDASDTTIYEGDSRPHIEVQKWQRENEIFFPFGPALQWQTYNVHVPVGSVAEGYEVAP